MQSQLFGGVAHQKVCLIKLLLLMSLPAYGLCSQLCWCLKVKLSTMLNWDGGGALHGRLICWAVHFVLSPSLFSIPTFDVVIPVLSLSLHPLSLPSSLYTLSVFFLHVLSLLQLVHLEQCPPTNTMRSASLVRIAGC